MRSWGFTNCGAAALALLMSMGPLSCRDQAKHDHSAHEHSDRGAVGGDPAAPAAGTYADAVGEIRTRMTSLDAILKSGDYDSVHKDSVAIGRLCKSLPGLAAAPNSGVPKDRVKDVTDAAAELATVSREFHSAAHDEDAVRVKEHYAHMGRLVESLAEHSAGR